MAADWNKALEEAAKVVDQCNREGPYNAIGAASRIRALKRSDAEPDPLRRTAAHLCAFDWESATSPASNDLNARILALRAELDR